MTEPLLLRRIESGVLRLTLNRPDAANALLPEQRDEMIAAIKESDRDPDVRVIVIAGNGRHFCSGADVGSIAGNRGDARTGRTGDAMQRILSGAQQLIATILDAAKPVIASVQGAAAGLGAHIALASDLVVAADNANFIEAFIQRGIIVDSGGSYLLPRRIGMQKAKELVFFGDKLPAAEARELGMVNQVVPLAELGAATDALAARLAQAPTLAVSVCKRLLNRAVDADRAGSFLDEAMAQEMVSHSHDAREGVQAFLERRPPKFLGY
ncbi:MAG: enoyl-CoA hydratase/isomerase family protein [Gammaproteobacteria bacterium]